MSADMDDKVKQLIDRYLYDVVRHLPEKQREDIKRELQTLIEDMAAERAELKDESEEACIRGVLTELGSPEKLSRSYRGDQNSLISGEYYDKYCYLVKTVLIWVGISILISAIVSGLVRVVESYQVGSFLTQGGASDIKSVAESAWDEFAIVLSIPAILLNIFGVITLVFAIMERKKVKLDIEVQKKEWKLEDLPEIPQKKAVISRGESMAGVVFGVLFLMILLFAPQVLGARIKEGDFYVSIPLLNLTVLRQVMPFIVISVIAGLMDDMVKLIVGKYSYTVLAVNVITGAISMGLTFFVFKFFPIWNPEFMPKMAELTGEIATSKGDIFSYFNTAAFTNGFLLVFFIIMLLDMGLTVYYTVRYGESGSRKN